MHQPTSSSPAGGEGTVADDERTVDNMELVGGHRVLDLVNTLSDRASEQPHERLHTYADLVAWCRRTGVLNEADAAAALHQAESDSARATAAHREILRLREALFGVFLAAAEERAPDAADLDALNGAVAEALGHRRLTAGSDGFAWQWADDLLDRPRHIIAAEAGDLLAGGDIARIKRCGLDSCMWLFVDLSKNRSRRWCTMDDCGNRAKARRHYHRKRSGAG